MKNLFSVEEIDLPKQNSIKNTIENCEWKKLGYSEKSNCEGCDCWRNSKFVSKKEEFPGLAQYNYDILINSIKGKNILTDSLKNKFKELVNK